jgi:hypothetical protein
MILETVTFDKINHLSPFEVIYITGFPIHPMSKISNEVLKVPYFKFMENKDLYKGYHYISKRIKYFYLSSCC